MRSILRFCYYVFKTLIGDVLIVNVDDMIVPMGFKCKNYYQVKYLKEDENAIKTFFKKNKILKNPNELGDEFEMDYHDFGTHSKQYIEKEKSRLTYVCDIMRIKGYHPYLNPDGFIRGKFNNKNQFVILGGQHRCSALIALGHKHIMCMK